jgi:hypothetical protein
MLEKVPNRYPTWVAGPCRRSLDLKVEMDSPIGPREWDEFSLKLQEELQNNDIPEFKTRDVGLGYQWYSAMPASQCESLSMIWRQIKLRLFSFRVFRPWNQIYYSGARIHRIYGASVEPHVEIRISEE